MDDKHIIVPETDVRKFLDHVMVKISVGLFCVDAEHPKNIQALVDLGLTPMDREEWVKKLRVKHYSHCYIPCNDDEIVRYNGNMWVFGIKIKKKEVYVKIALGKMNNDSICISFHPAEYPLNYPYKKSKL